MEIKNTKYALRAANPRAADRLVEGWPPKGLIVLTSLLPPNYYPFSVPLIMEFTPGGHGLSKVQKKLVHPTNSGAF
jgi:hypothetical protein